MKYHELHEFCPSFDIIFTGNKAVVSIKHRGEEGNTGHVDTSYYGSFFWIRLMFAIRKCFREQIKHKQ